MYLADIRDEIKLELTGGVLELEIDDSTLDSVIHKALREVQRYIDTTKLITIPYASCIDISGTKLDPENSAIVKIYRTEGFTGDSTQDSSFVADPMYAQMWMTFTNGGTMYNLNDYIMNYISYNTLLQMRNTTSTDLAFREDSYDKKLYINCYDKPTMVTVEYVPKFFEVEDIESDYWVDILIRLSIALTKIVLGRIRSRYTQSNALWTQDGDKMLEEGNAELTALRETLRVNSQLNYPID